MTPELREIAIRVLIICVAVSWLVILWRGDRDPALKNFSFRGLIMTRDGFIDRVALMELGTWIVVSLVVIALAAHDKLTEWVLVIYVAFPAVRAGQVSMQKAMLPPPVEQSSVTTTDSYEKVTKEIKKEPKKEPDVP